MSKRLIHVIQINVHTTKQIYTFCLFAFISELPAMSHCKFFLYFPMNYSKIPILRPPFGLPKSGLIKEVVLITNTIS